MVLGDQIRSLAQGIQQTFSGLMEGRLKNTNYVVVIVTAPEQETQSCVIVTGESFSHACEYKNCNGIYKSCEFSIFFAVCSVCRFQGKHQCRALAESMFSPIEGLREINHQLSTGIAQELIHYCNYLGQGGSGSFLWFK